MKRDEFVELIKAGGEVPLDMITTFGFTALVTMCEYLNDSGAGLRPVILTAVECGCCDEVSLIGYIPEDSAITGIADQLHRLGALWRGQS